MVFPNVDYDVKAVASVVAWPWELEHQQQLLLGPLLMSEGDPAVLFSSALLCVCVCVSHSVVLVTCVQVFGTLWTVACQASLSMKFSRQEYWSIYTQWIFPTQ